MRSRGKNSAGILMFRIRRGGHEFLLLHPGGPFWRTKDDGSWTIPKGLIEDGEDPLRTAQREFEEETACRPEGPFHGLGVFKQPSGKLIAAWSCEGDFDLQLFHSNFFEMEWPPRSGHVARFPEADRAEWFDPAAARIKLSKGQVPILEAALLRLTRGISPDGTPT